MARFPVKISVFAVNLFHLYIHLLHGFVTIIVCLPQSTVDDNKITTCTTNSRSYVTVLSIISMARLLEIIERLGSHNQSKLCAIIPKPMFYCSDTM